MENMFKMTRIESEIVELCERASVLLGEFVEAGTVDHPSCSGYNIAINSLEKLMNKKHNEDIISVMCSDEAFNVTYRSVKTWRDNERFIASLNLTSDQMYKYRSGGVSLQHIKRFGKHFLN